MWKKLISGNVDISEIDVDDILKHGECWYPGAWRINIENVDIKKSYISWYQGMLLIKKYRESWYSGLGFSTELLTYDQINEC